MSTNESPLKRFRDKLERKSEGKSGAEEFVDEEGNPIYTFEKGLPDFLDSSLPAAQRDRNRDSFKQYVQKRNPDIVPIIERVFAGNTTGITKEQFDQFTESVAEFKEDWESAKKLVERVSDDMIERMAKLSNRGEFGTYVYSFGVQTMGKIWREKIPHLIVDDEERFEKLEEALNAHDQLERAGRDMIRERAERLGIREDKYEDIMVEKDVEVRREKIRNALDKKFDQGKDRWNKFWSYAGREAINVAKKGRDELMSTLKDMDEQIRFLAEMLAEATSDNLDIQQAVLQRISRAP